MYSRSMSPKDRSTLCSGTEHPACIAAWSDDVGDVIVAHGDVRFPPHGGRRTPSPSGGAQFLRGVGLYLLLSMYPRRNIWAMRSARPSRIFPRALVPDDMMSMSVCYPYGIDGPAHGTHTAGYLPALERRPGGGAPHEPFLVAEHHLAVGADVGQEGQLVPRQARRSMSAVISPPT